MTIDPVSIEAARGWLVAAADEAAVLAAELSSLHEATAWRSEAARDFHERIGALRGSAGRLEAVCRDGASALLRGVP